MVAVDRINHRRSRDAVRFVVANPRGAGGRSSRSNRRVTRCAYKKCSRYREGATLQGLITDADAQVEGPADQLCVRYAVRAYPRVAPPPFPGAPAIVETTRSYQMPDLDVLPAGSFYHDAAPAGPSAFRSLKTCAEGGGPAVNL